MEILFLLLVFGLLIWGTMAVFADRRAFKDSVWAARARKWEPTTQLESDFREMLRNLGYEEPTVQLPIRATRLYQLDFAYEMLGVAIEVDGPYHLDPDQAAADRERDQHLLDAGWRTVRIPYAVMRRGPTAVDQLLRNAGIPLATNAALFERRVIDAHGLLLPQAAHVRVGDMEVTLRRCYPTPRIVVLLERDAPSSERWEIDQPRFRELKSAGWTVAVVTREMLLRRPAYVSDWLHRHGVKLLSEVRPEPPAVDVDNLPF